MKKFVLLMIISIVVLSACRKNPYDITESDFSIYNAVIYEVNIRNYTEEGTFEAFQTHLPRLKELGVDILWLMPIHPISKERRLGSLGSFYAVSDFKAVNPEYGDFKDFKALVDKAHEMGFKVILDFVGNHTGWDHEWITSHKEYYTQDVRGNIVIPPGTNWNDVADLNYENEDLREEMIDAMRFWVEEYDIDGYRCDYAGGVPVSFWEKARDELEKIRPVIMLAEDDRYMKLLDHAFQINYSFEMAHIINELAKKRSSANHIKSLLNENERTYPENTFPLYYTSNHDLNAWEGSVPERLGEAANAMNTIIFTIPGIPLIYSGQEVNLDKRLSFFDKDQIYWGDWENNETHQFYKQLIKLKKENPALWHDKIDNLTFIENDNHDVVSFVREKDNNRVIVLINLSSISQNFNLSLEGLSGSYSEYFSESSLTIDEHESFNLEPWEYKVFIMKSN